ncbi:MAG: flagellar hook-length control protein FliK [Nitrospirae bacterium]|nr:flagellar hook-length control protein FliK [Nitrospirota bacterium]
MKVVDVAPRNIVAAPGVEPRFRIAEGEMLVARVERVEEGGMVRLALDGGRSVLAETTLKNLAPGDTVRVRAELPPEQIILRAEKTMAESPEAGILRNLLSQLKPADLADPSGSMLAGLARLAGFLQTPEASASLPVALRAKLAAIADAMAALLKSGDADGIDGETLRSMIENSGLFMESRLASGKDISRDLKAMLLQLKQGLDDAAEGSSAKSTMKPGDVVVASFGKAVGDEIGNIEARQAVNVLNQSVEPRQVVIPIPLGQDFREAELVISEDDQAAIEHGDAKRFRVRLILTMSNIGEIRADAVQGRDGVSIGIRTGNEKAYSLLSAGLDELETSLREKGVSVSTAVSLRQEAREMEARPQVHAKSLLIDVRA